MKLTNKYSCPVAIQRAINFFDSSYAEETVKAELTASAFPTPVRIRALMREHAHELEEDLSDKWYVLLGSVVHRILEISGTGLREKRFYADIDGATISAKVDSLSVEHGVLTEWKLTSVWTVVFGGRTEWEEQMNVQAEVLDQNGIEVKKLQVVCLLRDWDSKKARPADPRSRLPLHLLSEKVKVPEDELLPPPEEPNNSSYPEAPWVYYSIPLWEKEKRLEYIKRKLNENRLASLLGALPECTPEERWERYDKRRKQMVSVRCERYCPVSKWCDQYAKELEIRYSFNDRSTLLRSPG